MIFANAQEIKTNEYNSTLPKVAVGLPKFNLFRLITYSSHADSVSVDDSKFLHALQAATDLVLPLAERPV